MNVTNDSGMFFIQALFALAIFAFIILIIIEKRKPYRQFPTKSLQRLVRHQYHRIFSQQPDFIGSKGIIVIFCSATICLPWPVKRFR